MFCSLKNVRRRRRIFLIIIFLTFCQLLLLSAVSSNFNLMVQICRVAGTMGPWMKRRAHRHMFWSRGLYQRMQSFEYWMSFAARRTSVSIGKTTTTKTKRSATYCIWREISLVGSLWVVVRLLQFIAMRWREAKCVQNWIALIDYDITLVLRTYVLLARQSRHPAPGNEEIIFRFRMSLFGCGQLELCCRRHKLQLNVFM